MTAPTSLRPLTIGEILDVALKITRRQYWNLVILASIVLFPAGLLTGLLLTSAIGEFQGGSTTVGPPGAPVPAPAAGSRWTLAAAILVALVIIAFAANLASAPCVKLVGDVYLDEAPTWRSSLRYLWARVDSVLWVTCLMLVMAGVPAALVIEATVSHILPTALRILIGVFGYPALATLGVWIWISWTEAIPVALLERQTGTAALRRSMQLIRHRWWPALGTVLLMSVLAIIVLALFVLLGVFLLDASFSLANVTFENTIVRSVVITASITALFVITLPFGAAAIVSFYFDLRIRKEGYDLVRLAQELESESASRLRAGRPSAASPELLVPWRQAPSPSAPWGSQPQFAATWVRPPATGPAPGTWAQQYGRWPAPPSQPGGSPAAYPQSPTPPIWPTPSPTIPAAQASLTAPWMPVPPPGPATMPPAAAGAWPPPPAAPAPTAAPPAPTSSAPTPAQQPVPPIPEAESSHEEREP